MSFNFPPYYDFPPFWTIQPVTQTQMRQIEMWIDLILKYMQKKNQTELDITKAAKTELFMNSKINRQLSIPEIVQIIDQLVARENAQWLNDSRTKCKIIWRKAKEWAAVLERWAHAHDMLGVILTFYELRESDDTQGEPFHMMDIDMMLEAVKFLVKKGKAELLTQGAQELDEYGVKFK